MNAREPSPRFDILPQGRSVGVGVSVIPLFFHGTGLEDEGTIFSEYARLGIASSDIS